jgi:hypothetical protein
MVELQRDEEPFAARSVTPAPDDTLLGARCLVVVPVEGPLIVLLEPSTEGLLAASLARYGEGPAVAYLAPVPRDADVVARAAPVGVRLSPVSDGPLGPSRLVLAGRRWRPHLILVEQRDRGAPQPPAATIER